MHRRLLFASLALAATAAPAATQPFSPKPGADKPGGDKPGADKPAKASPRRIAELFAASLSAHSIEAFGSLFADSYRNHQVSAAAPPAPGRGNDKQATLAFFQARLWGLPDLRVSIESIVADDAMVAASFLYTGTHQGVLMGVAATGKRLRFTSCDIFSVRDGLIGEHWGMGDIAGVLAQLRSS